MICQFSIRQKAISRKFISVKLLFLCLNILYSQNENHTWIVGVQDVGMTASKPDTGSNKFFGANLIKFTNPLTINRYSKSLGLTWNVVNTCDLNGNLLFYSNGSKVFNSQHLLVENGDSLNYSSYWTTVDNGYYEDYLIGSYAGSLISIPNPSNKNQYYLISSIMNYDNLAQTKWLRFHKVVYSLIDMSLNNGKGKMKVKEQNLLSGDFSHVISACKHANGRDWWITARGYQDTNCYLFFKLDNQGIKFSHKQCIGWISDMRDIDNKDLCYGHRYSRDGKQYARISYKGIEVFNFDRCKGLFSNPRQVEYPFGDAPLQNKYQPLDIIFSPNNQFIYTNYSGERVYQFDLNGTNLKNDWVRVATYDGFRDTFGSPTTFSTAQLAPNGKIYLGNSITAMALHEIEFPDRKGLACNFKQHAVTLRVFVGGVPYYPNYNLGADTCAGSAITETETLDLKVYPNPAIDYVEVSSQKWAVGSLVELYNLLGQQVFPSIEVSKDGLRLDMRDLSEGIYLFQLRDKMGSVIKTEKVMISR